MILYPTFKWFPLYAVLAFIDTPLQQSPALPNVKCVFQCWIELCGFVSENINHTGLFLLKTIFILDLWPNLGSLFENLKIYRTNDIFLCGTSLNVGVDVYISVCYLYVLYISHSPIWTIISLSIIWGFSFYVNNEICRKLRNHFSKL